MYQPQENNPKGETHEDIGMLSCDSSRRRAVLRQFHAEGFVNQYVADLDTGASRFVLPEAVITKAQAAVSQIQ